MAGFVDQAQLHLKAGDGGAGSTAFRREAHVARGGPDGGDGGDGGDLIIEAQNGVVSLLAFSEHPHRRAENGTHGSGGRRHGKRGRDTLVAVPEGTILRTLEGEIVADLEHAGDRVVAASGGRGGRGNARFLTNRRRAPAFAEQGEVGEERWLDLELKLLADVALVGFPNAGKSTLISRLSAARPKIADYPFTTLEPNLGVVRVGGRGEGASEFVLADIPGLIEGASTGRGLGHEFLRHTERARALLVLADLGTDAGRAPSEQVKVLLHELGEHEPTLVTRPRIIVGSRADLVAPGDRPDRSDYDGELEISAVTGEGLDELVGRLARLVTAAREAPAPARAPVLHRPEPEGVQVHREGEEFVVEGRAALRAVAVSDLTDIEAVLLVQRRLKRLGVDRELARAGAREGDAVRIGTFAFTYTTEGWSE